MIRYQSAKGKTSKLLPAEFSLHMSPNHMVCDVKFIDKLEHTWDWHRLCGVGFLSGDEVGINFRFSHRGGIELCGYYKNMAESQVTDYAPFPLMTDIKATISIDETPGALSNTSISYRFDEGPYIRHIFSDNYIGGIAYRLGPRLIEPTANFNLLMDFSIKRL